MNEDTLRAAETWRTRGDAVALATLVRSRRSAPRPLGNKLAISARGEMAGSVSGGCVEGAVFEEAQSVLAGGPSKLLYYGIADDLAWNVGLTCGGEIWVWLESYHGWPVPAERSARVTVVEGPEAGRHLLVTHRGTRGGRSRRRPRRRGDRGGSGGDRARAQRDGRGLRRAAVRRGARSPAAARRRRCRRHRRVALPDGQGARLADGGRRSAWYVRDRRARAFGRPARGRAGPQRGTTSSGSGPRTRSSC